MPDLDMKKLRSLYTELCPCRKCGLRSGYCPQLRPPGPDYRPGGVVFVQINPGHIGRLTEERIVQRYKTAHARDVARMKADSTRQLLGLQESFLAHPTAAAYDRMRDAFLDAMSTSWGWPPGKYGKTVEAHGVSLSAVAIVNLAQCPVPGDAYGKKPFARCWEEWTSRMLALLQPSLIVAQGRQVFGFLSSRQLSPGIKFVEGLHHADRRSAVIKKGVLDRARAAIRRVQ